MKLKQDLAVKNNADWCEIVSNLHGSQTRVEENLWGLDKKAPMYYPDVITLSSDVSTDELSNFMQSTQTEYLKDSYASLHLEDFEFLFEASWIYYENREIENMSSTFYKKIHSEVELQGWNAVGGLEGILLPDILSHKKVSIYANEGEATTAGFIVNESDDTIGVSNVFSSKEASDSIWTDIILVINQNHIGKHIVGYESDETLRAAVKTGWENIGKLRVWRKTN